VLFLLFDLIMSNINIYSIIGIILIGSNYYGLKYVINKN